MESPATDEQKRIERARLEAMVSIAEAATCRRRILLRCFGEDGPENCGACDVCRNPPKLFDGTVPAQKLLSAVLRTGRRFGVAHLVDVLRGKVTDKVAQFSHDQLPTFGVGKDLSDQAWRGVARQLVALGALDVAIENHGELVPTDAAKPILKGEQKVHAAGRDGHRRRAARARRAAPSRPWPATRCSRRCGPGGSGRPRRRACRPMSSSTTRRWRRSPPRRPQDAEDLAMIPGVGRSKLERYADGVLRVVREEG